MFDDDEREHYIFLIGLIGRYDIIDDIINEFLLEELYARVRKNCGERERKG